MNRTLIQMLAIAALALLTSCGEQHPETRATMVSTPAAPNECDTFEQDRLAAGVPVWWAVPQSQLPGAQFRFTRMSDREDGSDAPMREIPNVRFMTDKSRIASGGVSDVTAAIAEATFPMEAIRIADSISFDRYPAVLELQKLLAENGWRELLDRPGLWVKE